MKNSNEKTKTNEKLNIRKNIMELLCRVNNGSITIVKQNNEVIQINLVEKSKLV